MSQEPRIRRRPLPPGRRLPAAHRAGASPGHPLAAAARPAGRCRPAASGRRPPARRAAGRLLPGPARGPASRLGERGGPAAAAPQPRSAKLALLLILAASFMVVLDFSIVNVALPSIGRELGLAASAVQWVVTGYAIAFGGLLILGGRAADLFGRRRMFVTGLLVFTAASLAGGLARDPVLLVAARAVQGAGAAMVAPAALSLITTGFPEGPRRTRALGWYGATASIGFVAGQVLGGLLVQFTTWRAVFLVNVPVGLAVALAAPRLLGRRGPLAQAHSAPAARPGGRHRLDVGGALLITGAVAALVFAVSQGNVAGWASPVVLSALAVAALAAAGFVLVESRHPDPLVRTGLLRLPSLRQGYLMTMLLGVWNGGEMLVLSLYFQQVLHDSALASGLAIAPQGIVGFTAGAFGARLAARIGVRRLLMVTSAATTAGFILLTQLPATGHYSPLLAAVVFVGFGSAGTAFGAMVSASRGVPDADQGVVGGVINTSRQLGAALGAALLPAIAVAAGHDGSAANATGDRAAMLAGAVAGTAALLVAWLGSRRQLGTTPERKTS
jgi:EmrB/QacA subfamily drug resistance transporter